MLERPGKYECRVRQAIGDRQDAADRSGEYIRQCGAEIRVSEIAVRPARADGHRRPFRPSGPRRSRSGEETYNMTPNVARSPYPTEARSGMESAKRMRMRVRGAIKRQPPPAPSVHRSGSVAPSRGTRLNA